MLCILFCIMDGELRFVGGAEVDAECAPMYVRGTGGRVPFARGVGVAGGDVLCAALYVEGLRSLSYSPNLQLTTNCVSISTDSSVAIEPQH